MNKASVTVSFLLSLVFVLLCPFKGLTLTSSLKVSNSNQSPNSNSSLHSYELGSPPFQNYDPNGELKQISVMDLTFDKKGYFWVATQDGAAYHNGRKWTNVAMPTTTAKDIRAIAVDSEGAILFGTLGGGVHRLKDGQWKTFDKKSGALPNNNVRSLLETNSKNNNPILWIGTDGGLVKYEDNKWTFFDTTNSSLPNNTINVLLEGLDTNQEKVLWIGTQNGLVKYTQDKWFVYDKTNSPLPNTNVTALLRAESENNKDSIWIGTQGGLAKYQQGNWTVFDSKLVPVLNNTVNRIEETKDGELWIATFGGGLAKYKNNQWFVFNNKNSYLPNNNVRVVKKTYLDGLCTLWIGTLGGIVKYQVDKWKSLTTKNSSLPGNDVRSFAEDILPNGQRLIWIGTDGGLVKYEDDKWTIFDTSNSPMPSNTVTYVLKSKFRNNQKILWVATTAGLVKYEDGKWTVFNTSNSSLPTNIVINLLESISSNGKKTLWIGTARGGMVKYEYEENKWTVFNVSNSPLPNNYVGVFFEQIHKNGQKSLWIGTYGGGLVNYQEDINKWTIFNSENSLLHNDYIISIKNIDLLKRQTLWVGTSNGLAFFDLDLEKWIISSDKNLLSVSTEVVSSIEQDSYNKIYICTYKNVICLSPINANNVSSPNYKEKDSEYKKYVFTTEDGLPADGVGPLATLVDKDGYLWVGNLGGIGILNTAKTIQDGVLKPLLIENILVNEKRYLEEQGADKPLKINSLDGAILNYNENSITFEYSLLCYLRSKETLYQSQLEGFDQYPSAWVKDYKRVYTNLNQGDYIFKVLAKDYNGNISEPLIIKFRIKPALWRTWWAYIFYVATIFFLTFSLAYYQVNRAKQKALLVLQRQEEQAKLKESQLRAEAAELQARTVEAQAKAIEEENKRKSQELAYARQIQLSLLPKENILLKDLEIFGQMRTATEVGGDYYDFIKVDECRYLIVIGDATGHGVGAGLVVGMCKALLVNTINSLPKTNSTLSIEDLLQEFNKTLKTSLADRRMGMCMSIALFDTSKMTVEICSSGMPFPLFFDHSSLKIETLEMRGQPLGFLKQIKLTSKTIKLEEGDSLILLSDGFDERKNYKKQIWGYQKVREELSKICRENQNAESIAKELVSSCDLFALGFPNDDDMTIVVIHRKPLDSKLSL